MLSKLEICDYVIIGFKLFLPKETFKSYSSIKAEAVFTKKKLTINEMLIFFKIVSLTLNTFTPVSFPMIKASMNFFFFPHQLHIYFVI